MDSKACLSFALSQSVPNGEAPAHSWSKRICTRNRTRWCSKCFGVYQIGEAHDCAKAQPWEELLALPEEVWALETESWERFNQISQLAPRAERRRREADHGSGAAPCAE